MIAYPKIVRMKMPRVYLSLLMTILSLSCYAQFRKYSNEFLNIGAGARGLAMGSAQVASVADGAGKVLTWLSSEAEPQSVDALFYRSARPATAMPHKITAPPNA